jgi:hypothetical protein
MEDFCSILSKGDNKQMKDRWALLIYLNGRAIGLIIPITFGLIFLGLYYLIERELGLCQESGHYQKYYDPSIDEFVSYCKKLIVIKFSD